MTDKHVHCLQMQFLNLHSAMTGPPVGTGMSHIHSWTIDQKTTGQTGPAILYIGGHFHALNGPNKTKQQITGPQVYTSIKSGLQSFQFPDLREIFGLSGQGQISSAVQRMIHSIVQDFKKGDVRFRKNSKSIVNSLHRLFK